MTSNNRRRHTPAGMRAHQKAGARSDRPAQTPKKPARPAALPPSTSVDHRPVVIGVLTAVTATVLGAWLLVAVPSVPTWIVLDVLGLLVLALFFVLAVGRRCVRFRLAVAAILLVAGTGVHAVVTRPSEGGTTGTRLRRGHLRREHVGGRQRGL